MGSPISLHKVDLVGFYEMHTYAYDLHFVLLLNGENWNICLSDNIENLIKNNLYL